MKIAYVLKYKKMDSSGQLMDCLAMRYGLRFNRNNNEMWFYLREEIADERTSDFLGSLLCSLFFNLPSDMHSEIIESFPEGVHKICVYNLFFALLDYVKAIKDDGCGDNHFIEKLREIYLRFRVIMKESLPEMYLLNDNTYSLVPVLDMSYGENIRLESMPQLLKGKIKKTDSIRVRYNNQIKAVYRNVKWGDLSANCRLYRDFENGNIYNTEDLYFIARSMCSAEGGKNKFLDIVKKSKYYQDMYIKFSWNQILNAIMKDDIPIPICEMCPCAKDCNHAKNMIETAKIDRNDVKILRKDKYKDDTLRLIQCWIISSQLEQAVGRARLLREECTVYVYAGFPVEQAEFVNGSFKNYFSAD